MQSPQNSFNNSIARKEKLNSIRSKLKQNPLLNRTKQLILKKMQDSNQRKSKESPEQTQQQNQFQCSLEQANFHFYPKSSDTNPTNKFQNNYKIQQKIGQGAHGVVKRCTSLKTKKQYAVKILRLDDQHIKYLKKNFVNIESLQHPSVIKYKAIYFEQKKSLCYLLMEYFPYPNLLQIQKPSVQELKKIVRQIIETLVYLHKNKICHRDIKPENILYDKTNDVLKVIDFGISKCTIERGCKANMLTHTGTLYYKAPQMFLGGGYDQMIDNWAIGVTIYKIVTNKTPFQSIYHNQTIKNILTGNVQFQSETWQKYGFLKDLVSRLLKRVNQRMLLQQALKHIWFDSEIIKKKDMINSHISFQKDYVFGDSIEDLLKNKSQNIQNIKKNKALKNANIKKQIKMQNWLKQNKFQGMDLTESMEFD